MGKPTKAELTQALAEAGRMREQGEDPHHVAKCLLNHDYRLKQLEQLQQMTEHYLRAGQGDVDHGKLVRMLEKIRSDEQHPGMDRN